MQAFWKSLSQNQPGVCIHASTLVSFQDEVNQIMETNLWLKQVSERTLGTAAPWW